MGILARHALSMSAAAALLTSCGAPQSPFVPTEIARTNAVARGAYARSLLYVYLGSVYLYTYPRLKSLGSLGVGGSLCSDKLGNIVVSGSAGTSQIWVYPHGGGKPIAHMYDPDNAGGCSVDPTSESIAVAGTNSLNAIVIWPYNPRRGWRLLETYNDPNMAETSFCAYDARGNLFVDGYDDKFSFMLAELPKGSSTFTTITLNRKIPGNPGAIQWYGKYLAIDEENQSKSSPAVIYRFAISGSSGRAVGVTKLTNGLEGSQFLILGRSVVIGPERYNSAWGLGFWHFPAGGAPFRTVSTYARPYAEALSPK